MNENLQAALVEILNRVLSGIDSSVEFMSVQLPDVINQLLLWYAIESAIFSIIGISILFLPFIAYKKLKNKFEKDDGYDEFLEVHLPTIILLLAVLFTSCSIINLDWLQIMIAPKIWLMEYASNLVN